MFEVRSGCFFVSNVQNAVKFKSVRESALNFFAGCLTAVFECLWQLLGFSSTSVFELDIRKMFTNGEICNSHALICVFMTA